MQLVHLPPTVLRPDANNSRTHSPEQVAQLVESIRAFGWCAPILIDVACNIVAGGGRHAAAIQMRERTVPCVVLSHLTEAQRRAYAIADNQLALNAGWDLDVLRQQVQQIVEDDVLDLEVMGFQPGFLEDLLEGPGLLGDLGGQDTSEPPAVSRPGDVWILGTHRLICRKPRKRIALTLLAKEEKKGRSVCILEVNPGQCDRLLEHWQERSGGYAVLEADGIPYNDHRAHRNGT